MKLLVFAHTPPPHHGQSYMVQLMIEALGGDCLSHPRGNLDEREVSCCHVNVRLSQSVADIGAARPGKLLRLCGYCIKAVYCRFRYGISTFYYAPAPPKRAALYRDWIVMILCRPFFKKLVLHWHAVGLGEWLNQYATSWEKRLTLALLGRADLAISLAELNRADAAILQPRHIAVIPYGIPDPCPDFTKTLLPERKRRWDERSERQPSEDASPAVFRALFLAHCMREKGLFDAIEAIRLAQSQVAETRLRLELVVAGEFADESTRREFEKSAPAFVQYVGFASGPKKARLFRDADCLCFPTYYPNEGLPVVLLEAMAHGLPPVTTRWRGVPEAVPADWPYLVSPRNPEEVAAALLECLWDDSFESLREHFLRRYELTIFARSLHRELVGLVR